MPPDDKKTNAAGDALTVQDIRNAVNTFVSTPVYRTYAFASPFITRHASDSIVSEKPATPTSESQDPIVGYRVWSLNSGGLLVSSIKPVVWPARQKMQRGTREEQLGLGIHAAKHLDRIFKPPAPDKYDIRTLFFEEQGLWDDYRGQVAGEVSLWGEVKEFKLGYTAEFAYPKRLWVPESMDVLKIMQLEKNYGVPVDTRPDLGPWKESATAKMFRAMFNVTPPFYLPTRPGVSQTFFQYGTAPDKDGPVDVTKIGTFDVDGTEKP